jgi:hypothetical protein
MLGCQGVWILARIGGSLLVTASGYASKFAEFAKGWVYDNKHTPPGFPTRLNSNSAKPGLYEQ